MGTVVGEGLWKRRQDLEMEAWPELAKRRWDFYKKETPCAMAWKCEVV